MSKLGWIFIPMVLSQLVLDPIHAQNKVNPEAIMPLGSAGSFKAPIVTCSASDKEVTFMFVQRAVSGSFVPVPGADGHYILTLNGIDPRTIYFSDRPERIAGEAPTGKFLQGLGFSEGDPPNAAIALADGKPEQDVVVAELRNPLYDPRARTLRYDVAVLQGFPRSSGLFSFSGRKDARLPEHFGEVSLFIDDCSDTHFTCQDANLNSCGKIKVGRCWNWSSFTCQICQSNQASACNEAFPSCCQGLCETNCNWSPCTSATTQGCNDPRCQQCLKQFNCQFSHNNQQICTQGNCILQEVFQCNNGSTPMCFYETTTNNP
jgi:hypothetical protein